MSTRSLLILQNMVSWDLSPVSHIPDDQAWPIPCWCYDSVDHVSGSPPLYNLECMCVFFSLWVPHCGNRILGLGARGTCKPRAWCLHYLCAGCFAGGQVYYFLSSQSCIHDSFTRGSAICVLRCICINRKIVALQWVLIHKSHTSSLLRSSCSAWQSNSVWISRYAYSCLQRFLAWTRPWMLSRCEDKK